MLAGMRELATRRGLGQRPAMTRERMESREMIREVSWHFRALLEREELGSFAEESLNK
jgi:hypothetical protein